MPSSNQNTEAVTRSELENQVRQRIMLSIGLKYEEKDQLIRKIPSLNEIQLNQLKKVFDDENQRKEQMLGDFFAKNPQLFPEFERFSQEHISSIYKSVEDEEKTAEVKRSQDLLQITY